MADLRRGWGTPARVPNSFNFMQFLGNFGKIISLESWRTNLGEILDPPLGSVKLHTGDSLSKQVQIFKQRNVTHKCLNWTKDIMFWWWWVGGGSSTPNFFNYSTLKYFAISPPHHKFTTSTTQFFWPFYPQNILPCHHQKIVTHPTAPKKFMF